MDLALSAAERTAAYLAGRRELSPAIFHARVLSYYKKYGRDLPWRHTNDPYAIFVSEVMLQQTQVPRVVQRFEAFMRAFPDILSLANAGERELLAQWSGMGYNRRALYLKSAARQIMQGCGGIFPREWKTVRALPGIGEATAKAICVYAFEEPLAYLETNIRTVFIHTFFPAGQQVSDSSILPLVEHYVYKKKPSIWYQALMDYGTALKKLYGNPSRRSGAWRKQGLFEGSDRQIRGALVRLLVDKERITVDEAAGAVNQPPQKIQELALALSREGLIRYDGNNLYLG